MEWAGPRMGGSGKGSSGRTDPRGLQSQHSRKRMRRARAGLGRSARAASSRDGANERARNSEPGAPRAWPSKRRTAAATAAGGGRMKKPAIRAWIRAADEPWAITEEGLQQVLDIAARETEAAKNGE